LSGKKPSNIAQDLGMGVVEVQKYLKKFRKGNFSDFDLAAPVKDRLLMPADKVTIERYTLSQGYDPGLKQIQDYLIEYKQKDMSLSTVQKFMKNEMKVSTVQPVLENINRRKEENLVYRLFYSEFMASSVLTRENVVWFF
jgi:hypothetical protein